MTLACPSTPQASSLALEQAFAQVWTQASHLAWASARAFAAAYLQALVSAVIVVHRQCRRSA